MINTQSKLVLSHISKSFANSTNNSITNVLQDINLTVSNGEFVCIVGPSGCGKSTILRLVSGLLSPTTGSITLNDKAIEGTDPNRGMAFQKATLFPWLTVKENVGFSLRMKKEYKQNEDKVEQLIDMAGLSYFKDAYPHQLSGGMAQRVSLLRTMINEPDIFLLDEPLGALDAFTRMNLQDELLNRWHDQQNIMLLVTHDVEEAIYLGTRVIVMAPRPGVIVEDISIDLPYPRNRSDQAFVDYRNKIFNSLNFKKEN